jgi:hypothetical protein
MSSVIDIEKLRQQVAKSRAKLAESRKKLEEQQADLARQEGELTDQERSLKVVEALAVSMRKNDSLELKKQPIRPVSIISAAKTVPAINTVLNGASLTSAVKEAIKEFGSKEFTRPEVDEVMKIQGTFPVGAKSPKANIASVLGSLVKDEVLRITREGGGKRPHSYVIATDWEEFFGIEDDAKHRNANGN